MQHRKSKHSDKIPECINLKNGWCRFSGNECWYKHSENKEEISNQSPKIKRLFDMMEKFAERMEMMEKQL